MTKVNPHIAATAMLETALQDAKGCKDSILGGEPCEEGVPHGDINLILSEIDKLETKVELSKLREAHWNGRNG